VAALPFHYYLALREDWIRSNTMLAAAAKGDDDGNAESLELEMA
jgi:hypothetical protein